MSGSYTHSIQGKSHLDYLFVTYWRKQSRMHVHLIHPVFIDRSIDNVNSSNVFSMSQNRLFSLSNFGFYGSRGGPPMFLVCVTQNFFGSPLWGKSPQGQLLKCWLSRFTKHHSLQHLMKYHSASFKTSGIKIRTQTFLQTTPEILSLSQVKNLTVNDLLSWNTKWHQPLTMMYSFYNKVRNLMCTVPINTQLSSMLQSPLQKTGKCYFSLRTLRRD